MRQYEKFTPNLIASTFQHKNIFLCFFHSTTFHNKIDLSNLTKDNHQHFNLMNCLDEYNNRQENYDYE